jgi:hypothetical protein
MAATSHRDLPTRRTIVAVMVALTTTTTETTIAGERRAVERIIAATLRRGSRTRSDARGDTSEEAVHVHHESMLILSMNFFAPFVKV